MNAARLRDLGPIARSLRTELSQLVFVVTQERAHDFRSGRVGLPLDNGVVDDTAAMIRQLDDHVLARLEHLDAPALVVVGGSTGSGKSLIVNSLVGEDVTRPGVLRPTTTSPALVHNAVDANWFGSNKILPGLARVFDGNAHGHAEVRLITSEGVPSGLALLDSPDIDSVSAENRALAAELLAAADLWIFVTTAARYADAVPWEFLTQSRDRGTPLVIVMNRVPAGHEETLRAHLIDMLTEHTVPADVFTITEQSLLNQRLPVSSVALLHGWLGELGSNRDARTHAIEQSVTGSLDDLATRTCRIADHLDSQLATLASLRTQAHAPYDAALQQIRIDISEGTLLKGEVLARWEELLGTGELLRQLRTGLAKMRDRIGGALTGRSQHSSELHGAVEHVVESLIRTRADEAASIAATAWRTHPTGVVLLADAEGLDRADPTLTVRAATEVREWQAYVLELIRNVGGNRKTKARVLSFGVNGVAMVVMMLVFSHTGGLTGAEVAVAGGASAVGHALLESLLGDQTVRTLASQARSDLERRVGELFASEVQRYDNQLTAAAADSSTPQRLRALAAQLRSTNQ